MESSAQQPSYTPHVLEEHGVNGSEKRNAIIVLFVLVALGLVVWYFTSKKVEDTTVTPEQTLQNLAARSQPVTASPDDRLKKGQELGRTSSAQATLSSEDRLQMLNSFTQ